MINNNKCMLISLCVAPNHYESALHIHGGHTIRHDLDYELFGTGMHAFTVPTRQVRYVEYSADICIVTKEKLA